ncbi:deacetylase sulfotransferase [Marmoricola endophyticus]|uniref:Deacetylase sulfotransferase n=1 Tax=Marmoricola endophyticus TaxID=2040280 RepID=A0A917BHE0_9ACTN|nr:deacetylase sulfotransferase [Marmoricola endophyticus]
MHVAVRGPVRSRVRAAQARHPALSPTTRPGPPDFVGIGAQRCGTSWWHSLIEQHPQVAPLGMGAKELHFFDEAWRADAGPVATARLATAYAAQFRRRPGQVAGEWTPRYLLDPWAVPRLLSVAPQARLLVMLRDPVARFRSGLAHASKTRPTLGPDDVTAAYARGLYAEQLARVLATAPREQVLVLQLEQCLAEPQRHLDHTFGFLGLEPHPVPAARESGSRNAAVTTTPVDPALLADVREGYREDVHRLVELAPGSIDVDLWPETVEQR